MSKSQKMKREEDGDFSLFFFSAESSSFLVKKKLVFVQSNCTGKAHSWDEKDCHTLLGHPFFKRFFLQKEVGQAVATSERLFQSCLPLSLSLSLSRLALVQVDGIEYFNTIVVQPHRKLVTNQGRGYHIRCRYKTEEKTLKSDFDVR